MISLSVTFLFKIFRTFFYKEILPACEEKYNPREREREREK